MLHHQPSLSLPPRSSSRSLSLPWSSRRCLSPPRSNRRRLSPPRSSTFIDQNFPFWVNYPFKQLLGWNILTFVDVLTVFRMLILSAVVVFIITVSAPRQSNLWTVKCPPPLCNNNVQWPYIYLLPPPSLYIPVYPFILSHSIIYCTAVYTIICVSIIIIILFIFVYFFYSHLIFIVCVSLLSLWTGSLWH